MMTLKIGIVSLNTILHYLIKWKIYIPCNTAVSLRIYSREILACEHQKNVHDSKVHNVPISKNLSTIQLHNCRNSHVVYST